MSVTPVIRRLRQEDAVFKANLGYKTKFCLFCTFEASLAYTASSRTATAMQKKKTCLKKQLKEREGGSGEDGE